MSCESADWVCLVGLVFDNDIIRQKAVEAFGFVVNGSGWDQVTEWVRQYGQVTIGLLGFTFGVWRWWIAREAGLHRRLLRYISENRLRLDTAVDASIEALNRPSGAPTPKVSLFAVRPLKELLRRKNWMPVVEFTGHTSSADAKLTKALKHIGNRIDVAEQALVSLRRQQAGAHLVKGAIAAAQAAERKHDGARLTLDTRALDEFRAIRNTDGEKNNLKAIEFEAHQLKRLKQFDVAKTRYTQLIDRGLRLENRQERALCIARAKRGLAEIALVQVDGSRSEARRLLVASSQGRPYRERGALALREEFAPFDEWEQIEQAELQYLAAYVRNLLAAVVLEAQHLQSAAGEYRRILDSTSGWFQRRKFAKLRELAAKGLARVEATQSDGTYDVNWLLP